MSIVVIGSSATDMISLVPHLPKPGETVIGADFQTAAGGKGANQAVAAARLGGDVTLLASIGQDHLGDQSIEGFQKDHLCVDYIQRPEGKSGVALIFVAENGENSIAVSPGSNALLSPEYIKSNESVISQACYLLAQLETPMESILAIAKLANKYKIPFVLNPAPRTKKLTDELLQQVSILTPNQTEACLLTGIEVIDQASAEQAAQTLLQRGVNTVILTLGEQGALIAEKGQPAKLIPGINVTAKDTTGAGDTFNGALVLALSKGESLEKAVRFANAAAAISVTRIGAQPSAPDLAEVNQLIG
ncbi:ribokinase [Piscirickettsia litoralis]|uniref:Ribokinase n=1 Tax=Piscirickettsia litoralis TaxID=1891921 RepID=A0ABX3A2J0_9GAMM|nr:ribokinase [Piscirickettsia litoralis]ODN41665.1 ribokinase [Piscirickettsia litoralis]